MISIYTNPIFHEHDTGAGHPESARRLDAAMEGVRRAGLTDRVVHEATHEDTDRIIAKVHSAEYERSLEDASRAGYRLFHSVDNPISPATFAAARACVSTTLAAADAIWKRREPERAFVVARPPGHHAEQVTAMGFCFFNTIACAAEWLRELPGIERVMIFDFDVHHGNGTQALFEQRPDVFYTSIHRFPFYPGTGAASELGVGGGFGFTRNWPMEAGAGDAEYLRKMEDEIVRVIDDYAPNALLLSSGFDAHRRDPLGGMHVTEGAYGEITRRVVECAERHCEGRVLSLLEGGYDMEGLAASVDEHVRNLA